MDDASNPFAPLTSAEIADGARQRGQSLREPEAKPICAPADVEPGAHAAARLYGRAPDGLWRYAMADNETAFYAARWNEADGKKTFRPMSWRESEGWHFSAWPDHRPLFNSPDLAANPKAPVVICEGEKAAEAAAAIFPNSIATTSSGGAGAAAKTDWTPLAGRPVLIWPDYDAAGDKYAQDVATMLAAVHCSISIVDPKALASIAPHGGAREPREKWDAADAAAEWPDLLALGELARRHANPFNSTNANVGVLPQASKPRWPDPKPLPDGLLPVAPFEYDFLPSSIAPWVADIAERMQCPPDFVGVAAMVALGSVIGCKIGVRPQRKTDWLVVPNLWACIIGRPGAMKSPAMAEALKPMNRLDALARKENEEAATAFAGEAEVHKLAKEEAQKKVRAALKNGRPGASAALLELDELEIPKARRYVVNDCTYEALGAIMADNPNGVLAFRDELVSLLKTLDREDNAAARGFFLSAWNGTSGYTFDRIIRGRVHIDAACLSL